MIKSKTNFNLHPLLKSIIGNKVLDYRLRTRIDDNYIPQIFNNRIIFQSLTSFQQNNKVLGLNIRKFVSSLITTETINAIGGESYLYNINKKCRFYTDSKSIIKDAVFNNYKDVNTIDYNKDKIDLLSVDSVLNLSTLNINLMKQINNSSSNRIIIINCNHKDFWKKVKLLTNYKLVIRKKFVDYKVGYYITVNLLVRKSFVSLGGNCSVTYQLNKLGLRNKAYPFDWSQIKISSLVEAFKSNFEDYQIIYVDKYSDAHNSFIVKNKYAKFAHEVLNDNTNNFSLQLVRRIERLKEIENPVFVRLETFNFKNQDTYKDYWIKLCSLLDAIFDKYKIILVSKINPKLDKIKWIPYDSFDSEWQNNKINWFNIFI